MYTIQGEEVELVKKLEQGYLAKMIYTWHCEDEEEDPEVCDEIRYFENLFDSPPVEKISKEIIELTKKRDEAEEELGKIRELKKTEEFLLNKINSFPVLKKLANYLTQSFNFYLDFYRYEITPKNKKFFSPNIKVVNFKTEGWCLYRLERDNYEDSDDKPFMVFDTIEEAVVFSKQRLLERLKAVKAITFFSRDSLVQEFNNISISNPVKKDPEFLKAYEETLYFLQKREEERIAEKLKKEIQEYETKLKKLSQIQQGQQ